MKETPLSFSPHPIVSWKWESQSFETSLWPITLSGSDQSKSQSNPWSGTSVGRMIRLETNNVRKTTKNVVKSDHPSWPQVWWQSLLLVKIFLHIDIFGAVSIMGANHYSFWFWWCIIMMQEAESTNNRWCLMCVDYSKDLMITTTMTSSTKSKWWWVQT